MIGQMRMMIALIAQLILLMLAGTPQAPTDLRSCLHRAEFAGDWHAMLQLRLSVAPAEWDLACREARQAEERREHAVAFVLSTGRELPGFAGAARMSKAAAGEADPLKRRLLEHGARDQAARAGLSVAAKTFYAPGLSAIATKLLDGLISAAAVREDKANRRWLNETINQHGWFEIGKYGTTIDATAWLLVQHGDADRVFQKRMIDLLEPLAEKNQTNPANFALLFDRWAAATNTPTRFGLQGVCAAIGKWEPLTIADPVAVDRLRLRFGLRETLEEQIARESRACVGR